MKREDLAALGLTDEQIEKIIAENSKDVQNANKNADKYKTELESLKESAVNAEELQKKIEEIEQSKMTETEKIAKELEKANQRVADLEKLGAIRDQREAAITKFHVTAEQAKQIVKDDGSFDYDVLGQIIADKESAAALAKEQEIANLSGNPGGQGAGGSGDGKSSAVKLVERHFGGQKQNNDVLSHYLNGGN